MSDRHLYKAKRKDNGEWVAGCFLIDYITGQYFIHACGNSVNESAKIGEEGCLRFVAFEVDPATLCQCTGVKDKNGRLIWENDMVRRKILGCEVIGIVKWTDIGFTGFKLEVSNKNGSKSFYAIGQGTYDDDMSERCDDEVIGNVFDNLELLEGGRMTEKEAAVILKTELKFHPECSTFGEALDMAVQALEEIQEYRAIGTADECRAAVEKQKQKKPIKDREQVIRYTSAYSCPSCGRGFTGTGIADYCYHCGQRLDWSDNDV